MKKRFIMLIPAGILGMGFLLMLLFLNMREDAPKRAFNPRPKLVETMVVNLDRVVSNIQAYGRAASKQPIELFSEVSGTIMAGDVPFLAGQSFQKGDLILKIDDRQTRFQLESKKSEFLSALAVALPEIKSEYPDEYDIWQDYFDNCSFSKKLAHLPEVDNRKIKLILARLNVYKLYYAVLDLEVTLEKHFKYAPFDGSIVYAEISIGSTARNGSYLGTIINLQDMEVEVPVPIEDMQWVDFENPIIFKSKELGGQWVGKIKRVGSTIDERTQTIPIYMSAKQGNPHVLINGIFLEANIPGLHVDSAVVIPRRAIYNEKFVYLVENGKFVYREVSVARRENGSAIIDGGLNNGDTLVIEVMQGIAPGMPAMANISTTEDRSQ